MWGSVSGSRTFWRMGGRSKNRAWDPSVIVQIYGRVIPAQENFKTQTFFVKYLFCVKCCWVRLLSCSGSLCVTTVWVVTVAEDGQFVGKVTMIWTMERWRSRRFERGEEFNETYACVCVFKCVCGAAGTHLSADISTHHSFLLHKVGRFIKLQLHFPSYLSSLLAMISSSLSS